MMDFKVLVGRKVVHRFLGIGTIVDVEENYVTVDFNGIIKKFQIESMDQFFHFDDEETRVWIQNAINEIKTANANAEAAKKAAKEATPQAAGGTVKKKKTLDEMFDPDYHVDKLARQPILTYQQVETRFGIRISGFGRGINPTANTVVLISSIRIAAGNFVYHDKWATNGNYIYSGEGKTGDQKMTNGNLEIKDAAQNHKEIHLFVKFSPQEYYYQGIFELINYTYEDDKDEEGNVRKEYKFHLRKVSDA